MSIPKVRSMKALLLHVDDLIFLDYVSPSNLHSLDSYLDFWTYTDSLITHRNYIFQEISSNIGQYIQIFR